MLLFTSRTMIRLSSSRVRIRAKHSLSKTPRQILGRLFERMIAWIFGQNIHCVRESYGSHFTGWCFISFILLQNLHQYSYSVCTGTVFLPSGYFSRWKISSKSFHTHHKCVPDLPYIAKNMDVLNPSRRMKLRLQSRMKEFTGFFSFGNTACVSALRQRYLFVI